MIEGATLISNHAYNVNVAFSVSFLSVTDKLIICILELSDETYSS